MKRFLLPFFYFFAFSVTIFAQLQFTNYTNMNNVQCIATAGDSVWIGTTAGIVIRHINGSLLHTYTIEDGLPSNRIQHILVDSQGNVWCAMDNRVVRFDNTGMTTIPEIGYASEIFEDSQGNIWFIGSWQGIVKYDGTTWTYYTTSDGLPENYMYTIFEDSQGNMWFGNTWGDYGAIKFDGTTWTTYKDSIPTPNVYAIEEDNAENMWFGTNGGASKFDGIYWENFTGSDSLLGDYVYDIHKDNSGNLWFGISGAGINKYDGTNWYSYTQQNDSLGSNWNYYIFEDTQGNLWFHGDYLDKFDGTQFTNYTTSNGLSGYCIYENQLAEDKTGNLWIGYGCSYKGVDIFDVSNFTNHIVDSDINSNSINDILKDHNGDLWFAVSGADSLLKFDGTNWSYPGYHMGINTSNAYSLFEDRDSNLWFGIYSSVGKWDGTTWTNYYESDGLAAIRIESMSQDTSGNMWFGGTSSSSAGASKFDGIIWTTYTTADGLDTNMVYDLLADSQGNIWFAHGSYGSGVSKYNGSAFSVITPADGIYSNRVYSIFEDSQGNIWLGQNYAVSKYNGTSWTYWSSSEGFPGGYVYDITEDELGILWFATSNGLIGWDGTNWLRYSMEDNGLVSNSLYTIEIDDQGNKWIGTRGNGLSLGTCEKPTAGFTYSGTAYPDSVVFTNTSTTVDVLSQYQWDINDDGSIEYTTENPKHPFDTAGTYTVKMVAWNGSCSDTITQSVTVEDKSLAGTYTIGSTGDYLNFTEAVNDLKSYGVHGNVTFIVDSGTYNEQITIPDIYHASDTSTVTFRSATGDSTDVVLTWASGNTDANFTLLLDSACYIIFKNITLSATGSNYGRVIEITNGASYNQFINNQFIGTATTDDGDSLALVHSGNHMNNFNLFTGNYFKDGSQGLLLEGADASNPEKGTEITYNHFVNQYNAAIFLIDQDSAKIIANIISQTNDISGYYYGIMCDNCDSTLIIAYNLLSIKGGAFGGCPGINIWNCDGDTDEEGVVFNNFIHVMNHASGPNIGIYYYNSTVQYCLYNTVSITGNYVHSKSLYLAGTLSNITIQNNILANAAGGYTVYSQVLSGFTTDFNNYYTTGLNLGFYNGSDLSDLSTWKGATGQDANSISVDPLFYSEANLHSSNIALKAADPVTEITTDIDGETRDAVNPCMGADEFIYPALGGDYTIGPTAGDFLNFTEAVDAMINGGLRDAVTFNVESGTYTEQISIPEITGASDTTNIIFQSEDGDSTMVILTWASSQADANYTLQLDGADYVIFRGMTLQATGVNYARVVDITNGAHNNELSYNRIIGVTTTGTGLGALIYSEYQGSNDNNNLIEENRFEDGTEGLYLSGVSSSDLEKGTYIFGNHFINQIIVAINLENQYAPVIDGNIIQSDISGTSYSLSGIVCSSCDSSLIIINNRISLSHSAGTWGLYISNCQSGTGDEGLIANNFIHVNSNGGNAHGIQNLTSSSFLKYYHNSVNMTGSNTSSYGMYLNDNSDTIYTYNNIVANQAGGLVFYAEDQVETIFSDYNNYYTTGTVFCHYMQDFSNLDEWNAFDNGEADTNSISVDPEFFSDSDLHTVNKHLKAGTPLADVDEDIDGETRDVTKPFIGADEYLYTPGSENDILTFSFAEQTGDAVIDANNHTVDIEVFDGTDVTASIASFTISDWASVAIDAVPQESGVTINDFTNPVTYTVTAEDGTPQDWVVTVIIGPPAENDILNFSFIEQTGPAVIDNMNHTISVEVTSGADLTSLFANFTISIGASINIGGTPQESGVTANDFSSPVTYTVEAFDGALQDWVITVSVEISLITTFPYYENFESGPGGWKAQGTNSSWELGTPAGSVIDAAGEGSISWVTHLAGDYNPDEVSFVISPTFDFTSLTDAAIAMKIWWNSEGQYDGTCLQYTTDGGATWLTLGKYNDLENWYNTSYIHALFSGVGDTKGWSGDGIYGQSSNGWITARHKLSDFDGTSSIKFRFAFASTSSYENEGFAFDSIKIYSDPTVSVPEKTQDLNLFQVFPNPNKGTFFINARFEKETEIRMELVNPQGQIIFNLETQANKQFRKELDVSYLPAGIYYLKMTHEETVVVKKIVIE